MPNRRVSAPCLLAALLCFAPALAHDPAAPQPDLPNPADGAVTPITVTIDLDAPVAQELRVRHGALVQLSVFGAGAAELHLHGYGTKAEASGDGPAEFLFRADSPGRFPVEIHLTGDLLGRSERAVLYIEVRDE